MKIKLLHEGYKKDEKLYEAFVAGELDESFFSDEVVTLPAAPDFPIYMAKGLESKKREDFLQAFHILGAHYVNIDRDIHLNERFWHSLLVGYKRAYIIEHYPQVLQSERDFENIVLKKFDWENYIYKCVLAVEYVEDATTLYLPKSRYYELIFENLDIFNYIIKYAIFRNSDFVVNILTVIERLQIGDVLKARILDRPDLGKDERYGRRVIFELNKAYPVLMSPLLSIDELEQQCLHALSLYYDISTLPCMQR